ncbi:ABATE domain-containing protein [Streptomyces sp. NPDC059340]|uniref:ABATE domain-containing protein n=1 Tax=Streptomyces sp. NPDC059340 TaxID=3346806 RepID=UPI0036BF6BC2
MALQAKATRPSSYDRDRTGHGPHGDHRGLGGLVGTAVRKPASGPVPDAAAVRRLRAAVRDVLDSHLEGRAARSTSVDDINAAAAAAPVSPRLVVTADGIRGEERWHIEHGGNAALAAIAAEAIRLLADNERLGLLRRCANPACSMLFLAENKRRKWCTSNICGQPRRGRPPLRTNPHRQGRRHLTRGAAAGRRSADMAGASGGAAAVLDTMAATPAAGRGWCGATSRSS